MENVDVKDVVIVNWRANVVVVVVVVDSEAECGRGWRRQRRFRRMAMYRRRVGERGERRSWKRRRRKFCLLLFLLFLLSSVVAETLF